MRFREANQHRMVILLEKKAISCNSRQLAKKHATGQHEEQIGMLSPQWDVYTLQPSERLRYLCRSGDGGKILLRTRGGR